MKREKNAIAKRGLGPLESTNLPMSGAVPYTPTINHGICIHESWRLPKVKKTRTSSRDTNNIKTGMGEVQARGQLGAIRCPKGSVNHLVLKRYSVT